MATHREFRDFDGNARKALKQFKWMRDCGPFHGVYLRRGAMWQCDNGYVNPNRRAHAAATYYEIANDIAAATGKRYRRAELATLRAIRTVNSIAGRLP